MVSKDSKHMKLLSSYLSVRQVCKDTSEIRDKAYLLPGYFVSTSFLSQVNVNFILFGSSTKYDLQRERSCNKKQTREHILMKIDNDYK